MNQVFHIAQLTAPPRPRTLVEELRCMKPGSIGFQRCYTIAEKSHSQSRIAETAKKVGLRVKTQRVAEGVSYQVLA